MYEINRPCTQHPYHTHIHIDWYSQLDTKGATKHFSTKSDTVTKKTIAYLCQQCEFW